MADGGPVKSIRATFVSLSKRPFLRNVAAVASGTAAAQAITMAFAPIITRLYGPEAFGVQGAFLSLVSIITPLSALAYPIAIVLPKSDTDAVTIKRLSMMVAMGMATLLLITLLMSFEKLADLLGDHSVAPFLWLLPIVVVLAAWLQVTQQWLIRKESFPVLARISVVQAFVVNFARIGLGLLSATATMLVVVATVGLGLHAAMQWWGGKAQGATSKKQSGASLLHQANLHRDFPLFRAPEMILNAVSESLPVLMLSAAFGPAEAGFYALARSVLYLPLNLVGQSVANVFFPRFNSQALKGRLLFPTFLRAVAGLAVVGLPIFASVYALSPSIFSILFGNNWEASGIYASFLCPWLFVMFMNRPCVGAVPVLGLQRFQLINTVVFLVIRISAILLGIHMFADANWTVALFSASGVFSGISILLITAIAAKKWDSK